MKRVLARPVGWLAGSVQGERAYRADRRYERTKTIAALDATIQAYKRAIAVAPPGSSDHVTSLLNLAVRLRQRHQAGGDPADLDAAIAYGRQAAEASPPLGRLRPKILENLALHLHHRYGLYGDAADLRDAMLFSGASARATPARSHEDAARRWSLYDSYAFEKFSDTGNADDLNTAINAARHALTATAPDDARRARRLADLAFDLNARFVLAQTPRDLDAALAAAQQAAVTLPTDIGDRSFCLDALAQILWSQFERTGDQRYLEQAEATRRQALVMWTPGAPERARLASSLAIVLARRYEMTGAFSLLREAENLMDEAFAAVEDADHGRRNLFTVRAMIRWQIYEQTGDLASLENAAADAEQAVNSLPSGDMTRPFALQILGAIELQRCERTGNTVALENAIAHAREAVNIVGQDELVRPAYLCALGLCIGRRYQRSGNPADLDDAIDSLREAVTTATSQNDLPVWLSNFGLFLRVRFERAGNKADIDQAIEAGRQSVTASRTDFSYRGMILSNLGCSLIARHARYDRTEDLDEAVEAMRTAADITDPGTTSYPVYRTNLGHALNVRFDRSGRLQDAEAAVQACRDALAALPSDHAERPSYLANLSGSLDALADQNGDLATAAEALEAARDALAESAAGHPETARCLRALGNALQTRYDLEGDRADLTAAFGAWRQAVGITTADPGQRLTIARHWGRTAANASMFDDATEAFAAAVRVLPLVVWHGLDPLTRQQQAAWWAGLSADAASCAVLSGQPELAVELLEQGRSMLWSQALNLRADLGDLTRAAPDLAERLDAARAIMNDPDPLAPSEPGLATFSLVPTGSGRETLSVGGRASRQEATDRRARAARDYDKTLGEIRFLAGFEHYLELTPYRELATASAGGLIVIVNASRYGCHAIIVTSDEANARVVDLPDIDLDSAEKRAHQISRLLADLHRTGRPFPEREADRRALLSILRWLWESIAQPILESIGDLSQSPLPRVWWCPTGPLVSLPLHAAGRHPTLRYQHRADASDTVFARTVSSYIPTLTALRRARGFTMPTQVRHLTVAVPEIDRRERPSLPDVNTELEHLTKHFPAGSVNHQLAGPRATRAAVLTAMRVHDWIHLACHAGPLDSDDGTVNRGFTLWDGDLTITDLAAEPERQGGLAFLSACQTATGSDEHLDEALHLAAAMQFLGYSHVVATMWSIADSPAPLVADLFYTTLSRDRDSIASALRTAILDLREMDPTNPFLWAPYIHFGC